MKRNWIMCLVVMVVFGLFVTMLTITSASAPELDTQPATTEVLIDSSEWFVNDVVEVEETTVQIETTEPIETLSPEELLWLEREKEYPIATQVWLYMKTNFGWNDAVCAGVMGNIMGEIGGGTLDFSDWNYNSPYGMFQWLGQRRTNIKQKYGEEPDIFEQLDFMYNELYGTNGVRKQVTDWQREKILNANTPEDAATYFCIYFERPGNSGNVRRGYAREAYNYFVSE